jgi:formate dehydrogenase iron-sulfur subunit
MKDLVPMSAATLPSPNNLVADLLREQQDLTAVGRFSQWHDQAQVAPQLPTYRDLIPLTAPGAGEQFAFEVDLDKCSGCKACVSACHALNGLDESETWRSVGFLQSVDMGLPVLRHVTTACHHCVEPACLSGCPTQAYEKDAVTGIVRHLDDQCFGCQYCILMCPYEVPAYSASRGIVRKCDMCRQRLDGHEAPACVQGCPNGAIAIRIVSQAALVERAASGTFLPTAPDPNVTKPTTTYLTAGLSDQVVAGDHDHFHPAHAHWPLVFMLVLTQMSVGVLAVAHVLIAWLGWLPAEPGRLWINGIAAAVGLVGANLALLHLGRPLQAYRAWVGWRTSWLSREVLAFGAYVPLVLMAAVAAWWLPHYAVAVELAAIACGIGAVYCSGMIYVATRRAWWSAPLTFRRFALSVFVLGNATCTAVAALLAAGQSGPTWWDYRFVLITLAVAAVVAALRRQWDRHWLSAAKQNPALTIRGCASLLMGPLQPIVRTQQALAILGSLLLPLIVVLLLVAEPTGARAAVTVLCMLRVALAFAGEIADRYLFFAACVSPRMPGAPLS